MLRNPLHLAALALTALVAAGCGTASDPAASATIDKTKYVLADEPPGAVGVLTAKEQAQDQDPIVLVGQIGGQKNPWIDGQAAFIVIDPSQKVVADGTESAGGEVCLDDCCAEERKNCTTLVKVVDPQGKPLAMDARELLDVKENDLVVVRGKVHRNDDEGLFSISADGVYVRR